MTMRILVAISVIPLLISCNGVVGDGSGLSFGAGPGDGPGAGPAVNACGNIAPGRVTVHRLTRAEYNNTVRDLLGDTSRPADRFPAEGAGRFSNLADGLHVSTLLFQGLESAARDLAAVATPKLIKCDGAAGTRLACARDTL